MISGMLPFSKTVFLLPCIILLFFIPTRVQEHNLEQRLRAPSAEHWFGTDDFGRDYAMRVFEGFQNSIGLAFQAVLASLIIGGIIAIGIIFVPALAQILNMLIDALLTFPAVLLGLIFVASFGSGSIQLLITLIFILSPVFARILRDEIRIVSAEEYIHASRLFAAPFSWILIKHILPILAPTVLAQSVSFMAVAVGLESAFSFLGIGLQLPMASIGNILRDAMRYLHTAPWLILFPGLCLLIFMLSINLLAEKWTRR